MLLRRREEVAAEFDAALLAAFHLGTAYHAQVDIVVRVASTVDQTVATTDVMVKRRSRVLRRRTRQDALDKPRVHDGQLGFAILEQKGQKRPRRVRFAF